MKKKFYYIICLFILFGFTSCKDMLKEESYGRPTAEELLSDPENVYKEVGQVYADLKWLQDHWNMFVLYTASSDEALLPLRQPGNDWDDGGYWSAICTMEWDANSESLESIWKFLQQGAVMCNQVMLDLENNRQYISDNIYNQAVAELIIVRSYYYYMLFDCFGRIPYARSFTDQVTSKPLATESETWAYLVQDLLENVKAMPKVTDATRSQWYGRATQGLGYGLLSRLMLNAQSFGVSFADPAVQEMCRNTGLSINSYDDALNLCIAYCDSVIYTNNVAHQQYRLESNYFNNFLLNNESSAENIFVIVNSASGTFDKQENAGREINKNRVALLTLFMAHAEAWEMYEAPWNGLCARESFLAKFAKDDVRGVCNADPQEGRAGTAIDFTNVNTMRGWFAGPIYAPSGFEINYDAEGNPTNVYPTEDGDIIIQLTKQSPYYGDDNTKWFTEAGKQIPGQDYEYDWNSVGPCYSVITVDIPLDPSGTEGVVTTNQVSGARCLKYEVQHNTRGTTDQYGENDFVLMRYAEILFNKAEAALRVGNSAEFQEVLPALTEIQSRAGVDESATPVGGATAATYSLQTIEGLLDERGRELYWEFLRRRDLIRFDKFSQGTWQFKTEVRDRKYDWFPIPALYIQNSGGVWTQRDGY